MKQNQYGLMGLYEYLGIPLKVFFLSVIKAIVVLFSLLAWVLVGRKSLFDQSLNRSVTKMTFYASEKTEDLKNSNHIDVSTFLDERFVNGVFSSITIGIISYVLFIQVPHLGFLIFFIIACSVPHLFFGNWRARLELEEYQSSIKS